MDSIGKAEASLLETKERLGEKHPAYGNALSNLADLYDKKGLFERAEPL